MKNRIFNELLRAHAGTPYHMPFRKYILEYTERNLDLQQTPMLRQQKLQAANLWPQP